MDRRTTPLSLFAFLCRCVGEAFGLCILFVVLGCLIHLVSIAVFGRSIVAAFMTLEPDWVDSLFQLGVGLFLMFGVLGFARETLDDERRRQFNDEVNPFD